MVGHDVAWRGLVGHGEASAPVEPLAPVFDGKIIGFK